MPLFRNIFAKARQPIATQLAVSLLFLVSESAVFGQSSYGWIPEKAKGSAQIRIATFNVSLNRPAEGRLRADLQNGEPQAIDLAAVIRAVRPDVILLNEVDFDGESPSNAAIFADKYLADTAIDVLGNGPWPMQFVYDASVNTGVPSGIDINQNGKLGEADDAWGYGKFPGQYGMAILSRFPIEPASVRSFQKLSWNAMPDARQPAVDGQEFYPQEVWKKLRLSSKSFWDVSVQSPIGQLHVLASHPTPPAFDGPEDRNGCRNHDEIRLLVDYLDNADYLVDDLGAAGGLADDFSFVVLGDLNSDPHDGGSQSAAIEKLLAHRRVAQFDAPSSRGAASAAIRQGKANLDHIGPAAADTADFSDANVGNLRVDYALPSSDLRVVSSGVFWPALDEVSEKDRATMLRLMRASDHHLVWIDVTRDE